MFAFLLLVDIVVVIAVFWCWLSGHSRQLQCWMPHISAVVRICSPRTPRWRPLDSLWIFIAEESAGSPSLQCRPCIPEAAPPANSPRAEASARRCAQMNYTWGGYDENGACNPFPNKYSEPGLAKFPSFLLWFAYGIWCQSPSDTYEAQSCFSCL